MRSVGSSITDHAQATIRAYDAAENLAKEAVRAINQRDCREAALYVAEASRELGVAEAHYEAAGSHRDLRVRRQRSEGWVDSAVKTLVARCFARGVGGLRARSPRLGGLAAWLAR